MDYFYWLLNNYRTDNSNLVNSRSWRLTRPLRKINTIFKAITKLFRFQGKIDLEILEKKPNVIIPKKAKLVLVVHELSKTGAPMVGLHFIDALPYDKDEILVISSRKGPLFRDFDLISTVVFLNPDELQDLIYIKDNLEIISNCEVILNTLTLSEYAEIFYKNGIKFTTWAHELMSSWNIIGVEKVKSQINKSSLIICDSIELVTQIQNKFNFDRKIVHIENGFKGTITQTAEDIRNRLSVNEDTFVFTIPGSRQIRKGFDLLPHLIEEIFDRFQSQRLLIIWIGDIQSLELDVYIREEIERHERNKEVLFLSNSPFYLDILNTSDAIIYLSREDSSPQVLKAAEILGKRIFDINSFRKSLNTPSISRKSLIELFAGNVFDLMIRNSRASYGEVGEFNNWENVSSKIMNSIYDHEIVQEEKLKLDEIKNELSLLLPITCIVIFYNQSKFVKSRLDSIFKQTHLPQELIVIDDDSSDDTRENITNYFETHEIPNGIHINIIFNKERNRIPTLNWKIGVNRAIHDKIWIAEGDDLSPIHFLDTMYTTINDCEYSFVVSENFIFNVDDEVYGLINEEYKPIEYSAFPFKFAELTSGKEFVMETIKNDFLSIGNIFYNVSSILWNKEVIKKALDEAPHNKSLFCDYEVYLNLPSDSNVQFTGKTNNFFRNHSENVRSQTSKSEYSNQAQQLYFEYFKENDKISLENRIQFIVNILRENNNSSPETIFWIEELENLILKNLKPVYIYFNSYSNNVCESDKSRDYFLESLKTDQIIINICAPGEMDIQFLEKIIEILNPKLILNDYTNGMFYNHKYLDRLNFSIINKYLELKDLVNLEDFDLIFFGTQEELYEKSWFSKRILFLPISFQFENNSVLKIKLKEFIAGAN